MKLDAGSDNAALLTILASRDVATAHVSIRSIVGRHMSVISDVTGPVGTPVRVQSAEHLYLAEILTPADADRLMVLKIRHVLRTSDVEYIRRKWM
jgi:hypothetical protein